MVSFLRMHANNFVRNSFRESKASNVGERTVQKVRNQADRDRELAQLEMRRARLTALLKAPILSLLLYSGRFKDDHDPVKAKSILAKAPVFFIFTACHLQAEAESYRSELDALSETPEQQRDRLANRARALKAARETERLALVEEKRQQQWRYVIASGRE